MNEILVCIKCIKKYGKENVLIKERLILENK